MPTKQKARSVDSLTHGQSIAKCFQTTIDSCENLKNLIYLGLIRQLKLVGRYAHLTYYHLPFTHNYLLTQNFLCDNIGLV